MYGDKSGTNLPRSKYNVYRYIYIYGYTYTHTHTHTLFNNIM